MGITRTRFSECVVIDGNFVVLSFCTIMSATKLYLRQLVSITAGFAPKAGAQSDTCELLQLANFDDEGVLLPDLSRTNISLTEVPQHHRLKTGDVLLAAKGARLFATHVEADWLPATAATTFLVLRLTTDTCLPKFLALWLNQPATRSALRSRLSATSVPTLNKRDVLELPLPGYLPPLLTQQHLIELNHLRLEEKRLALTLTRTREMEFQTLFTVHTSS